MEAGGVGGVGGRGSGACVAMGAVWKGGVGCRAGAQPVSGFEGAQFCPGKDTASVRRLSGSVEKQIKVRTV